MTEFETLKRAFLPEVLLAPDVAIVFRSTEEEARQDMESGRLGRVFRVGGAVGILRSDLIAHLRKLGRARLPEVEVRS